MPYLTLYLQNDLGYSPLGGGLRLLPMTILTFAYHSSSARLSAHFRLAPCSVRHRHICCCIAALLAVGPTLAGRSSSGMLLSGWASALPIRIARVGLGVVRLNAAAWRRVSATRFASAAWRRGLRRSRRVPATNHGFDVGECRRAPARSAGSSPRGIKAAAHGQPKIADAAASPSFRAAHDLRHRRVLVALGAVAAHASSGPRLSLRNQVGAAPEPHQ